MSTKKKLAHSLKHLQCLAKSGNGRRNESAKLEGFWLMHPSIIAQSNIKFCCLEEPFYPARL